MAILSSCNLFLSAQLFTEGMSRHTPGLHLTGKIDFSLLLMGLKAIPNLGSCIEIAVQCPDKKSLLCDGEHTVLTLRSPIKIELF